MLAEIVLQYRRDSDARQDDWSTQVDVTCGTELANIAYAYAKQSKADNVLFNFTGE